MKKQAATATNTLAQDRQQWEKEYTALLTRKNKFYEKLLANQRNPDTSEKYQELKTQTQAVWQKLHDTKPAFKGS